jgi:D-alanine-D-alanine ligase
MSVSKTAAIVHSDVGPYAPADEKDILVEVETVSVALHSLGYTVVCIPFYPDIARVIEHLKKVKPVFIFNLVESIRGSSSLIHLPILLFEYLNIPFTGSGSEAMSLTSSKVLCKQILSFHNIPTPPWQSVSSIIDEGLKLNAPCIIKPINEEASVDITDTSVFHEKENLLKKIDTIPPDKKKNYFVERFMNGREFNISLISDGNEVKVLPPAEILFKDYPPDKPRIVGYEAKWIADSFEYSHTPRTFEFSREDETLLSSILSISKRCWDAFGLKGYARVDFRTDEEQNPWVLEVNANPCISPDSGFIAACNNAGIKPYSEIIRRISNCALGE